MNLLEIASSKIYTSIKWLNCSKGKSLINGYRDRREESACKLTGANIFNQRDNLLTQTKLHLKITKTVITLCHNVMEDLFII